MRYLLSFRKVSSVDQFESVFRAATREIYEYEEIPIKKVLIVNDCDESGSKTFENIVKKLLSKLKKRNDIQWKVLKGEDFRTIKDLLENVERIRPDLIVTYRHLHSEAWQWPHSLGEHLDVLTQATTTPVLVLPHPSREGNYPENLHNTDRVLAITNHLTGDQKLVNFGVRFTQEKGTLYLAHIEDQNTYERTIELIGKIPTINTEEASLLIKKQLLKEPADYIESCRKILQEKNLKIKVEPLVRMGHHLKDYREWIDQHEVDLLIMNTKDEEQMAMHGIAYPLAVELRETALLLL